MIIHIKNRYKIQFETTPEQIDRELDLKIKIK